jgi:NADPH-dependent 2,4-dienoyl-CoA reductase/sulfur reductase-like enzyme
MTTLDVAVVGAGPAGLAAATLAAERGLSVSLYDEQRGPGGQVYRGITVPARVRSDILGDDYWRGASLVPPFERSGARYVRDATVWAIARRDDGTFAVSLSLGAPDTRITTTVDARAVILATGALERPFPVAGWTLPGVMAAGGAQILLKTSGVVPRGRTVLAGCGPLLWLLAWQYARAGVAVDALLDTTPRGRMAEALRHAPAFVLSPYFAKGLELVRTVRRSVRVVEFVSEFAIEGVAAAHAVRFRAGNREETLPADHVLLHQGVVPDVNLAGASGCALAWNELRACFAPVVDAWGGTSVPGLFIAGDGAGIAGAVAAEARGRLAALAAANAVGRIDGAARDRAARPPLRELARSLRGRRFLDVLYRPPDVFRVPSGAALACRCEEIPAAAIEQLAREGCAGPNQMKAYTRCGMGACQGRFCGLTVTELMAQAQRRRPADMGGLRARFPAKPVTLGELAALPVTDEALRAVVRATD